MGLFGKSKIEKKIDRLNSIWSSAVDGVSAEIEKEAFMLLQDILAVTPNNSGKKMLADCYLFGIGCNENIDAAKKLYLEVSQDADFSEVFKILGDIAFNEKDGAAFEYYKKYLHSNPNDNEVLSSIADCYYKGLGTPKNIDKAMSIYSEVSNTVYADTTRFQVRYGTVLDEQQNSESLNWLAKAANADDAWAIYLLASVLKKAKYLPFDMFDPVDRAENSLGFFKRASSIATKQNNNKLAVLAEDSYKLFEAELKANAFAFYFKSEDGKEVAYRCYIEE